jgi:hypothetical protein
VNVSIPRSSTVTSDNEDITCDPDILGFQNKIRKLELENRKLLHEYNQLKEQASSSRRLTYEDVKSDEVVLRHYTGLSKDNFEVLLSLYDKVKLTYKQLWEIHILNKSDQLLLTLMKLRCNFAFVDLAFRFKISAKSVRNIFDTWLDALHSFLFVQMIESRGIPSRFKNQKSLPSSFSNFKNTRIIVDGAEFAIEAPQELDKQRDTYSTYKARHTVQVVVGVAPNGCGTFCSKAYPGSRSDKEIVADSKLLEQMEPGDLIIADKGFLIHDLLPSGVQINMPPFLDTPHFTKDQIQAKESISRARVHVERYIKRLREFKILRLIPHSLRHDATKLIQTCFGLTGFYSPLMSEVSESMNI